MALVDVYALERLGFKKSMSKFLDGTLYSILCASSINLPLALNKPLPSVSQGGDLRGRRGRGKRHGVVEYKNRVVRTWLGFREKLRRIVESKYFNRGIMIAILVNTLSMGIEYHEQVRMEGCMEKHSSGP